VCSSGGYRLFVPMVASRDYRTAGRYYYRRLLGRSDVGIERPSIGR
jgi:hypothetical protein